MIAAPSFHAIGDRRQGGMPASRSVEFARRWLDRAGMSSDLRLARTACELRSIVALSEINHSVLERAQAAMCDAEQETAASIRDRTRRDQWAIGRYLIKHLLTFAGIANQRRYVTELARHARIALRDGPVDGTARRMPLLLSRHGHGTPGRGHVAKVQQPQLHDYHIISRDGMNRSVAPYVMYGGRVLPVHVSISHTDSYAAAAVSTNANVRVGIDLCPLDEPSDKLSFWLTNREKRQWSSDEHGLLRAWSFKEAAFKAIGGGRRFVPREIEVLPGGSEGGTFFAHIGEASAVRAVQTSTNGFLLSVVETGGVQRHNTESPGGPGGFATRAPKA